MTFAALLLDIFASDILPIFLVAGVGWLLAKRVPGLAPALSGVILYALAPCLIFNLLVTSRVSGPDVGRIALFCVLMTAVMGLTARLVAGMLRLDRPTLVGFMLAVMFSNGGNYGLPVTLFAFGRDALAFATVYFVTSAVLSSTVGVFLAASGRRTVMDALAGVSRVPTMYAVLAAGLVLAVGVPVPLGVMRPIGLLGDATIPMMLLVLGMQMAQATRVERPGALAAAVSVSLIGGPLVAFALARTLGLNGAAFQAAMIQASMPAAVITTILALEFDAAPAFVAGVVVVSTVLSPLTLTGLIAYLQQVA